MNNRRKLLLGLCVLIRCHSWTEATSADVSGLDKRSSAIESCEKSIQEIRSETLSRLKATEEDNTFLRTEMNRLKIDNLEMRRIIENFTANGTQTKPVGSFFAGLGGTTYVRWGRTSCETDANVLYDGYAAGSFYDNDGGGSNILCLPRTPQWKNINKGVQGSSNIFGVEYEFSGPPFSLENLGGQSLKDHDMPCALCHVQSRSHQVMIPARHSCPSGWILEYWGYVVASHYDEEKGEYICLDQSPEALPGGSLNQKHHGVFPVESVCGGLPCPPYFDGHEITCAVCSI